MKIVVIGASDLIGAKLVTLLRQRGHDVVEASLEHGVNTITREGLAEALVGAEVVVDVSNSLSSADMDVLKFFETSGRNILATEVEAGVKHHIALSIVGADRLPDSAYYRAKIAQEKLIQNSTIPYTILRSTQFFENLGKIIYSGTVGFTVYLSPAPAQLVAADDVAAALADITANQPVNGIVQIAGPERVSLAEFARRFLTATSAPRKVVDDDRAPNFGAVVDDQSLVPGDNPRIGSLTFAEWFARHKSKA